MVDSDTVYLFVVVSGDIRATVIGREASRNLCKRIESLDPYGGIPFVYHHSMSPSEALEYMQGVSVEQAMLAVERETMGD